MRSSLITVSALVAASLWSIGCADVRPPSPDTPLGVAARARAASADAAAEQADTTKDANSGECVAIMVEGGGVDCVPVGSVEEAKWNGDESIADGGPADEVEGDADDTGEGEGEDLDDDDDTDKDFMACLDRGPGSPPHCPQFTWKSPIEGLSGAEIEKKVKNDLASIGPISVGAPNRGRLFNGVQMPKGDHWTMTDPGNAWGTQETVDSITHAIDKVFAKFPDSHKVIIGHISAKGGGHLKPHKSHQAGRDVDLSYFYNDNKGWYTVATDKNLDRERTWTFVKAFIEDPNTEMILIDTSVQKLLYAYAKDAGEDQAFLDKVFQVSGKSNQPLIRHVKGHATHIHVRFFSPEAQASGRLAQAYLPKPPPPPKEKSSGKKGAAAGKDEDDYVYHRARSGDTLDSLARRYGVSVQAIKEANGLKSNDLKQKKTYRIPKPDHPSSSPKSAKKK
ncbi:MAG: penicillin-insensitive murein endopeptidase [Polyangiaceae bacterium]